MPIRCGARSVRAMPCICRRFGDMKFNPIPILMLIEIWPLISGWKIDFVTLVATFLKCFETSFIPGTNHFGQKNFLAKSANWISISNIIVICYDVLKSKI